jgi:hypothetical protein
VATLTVVMVLFFVVSLVAAYAGRTSIFEQRTSANQYRSTQALEAAEAGLEWAVVLEGLGGAEQFDGDDVAGDLEGSRGLGGGARLDHHRVLRTVGITQGAEDDLKPVVPDSTHSDGDSTERAGICHPCRGGIHAP